MAPDTEFEVWVQALKKAGDFVDSNHVIVRTNKPTVVLKFKKEEDKPLSKPSGFAVGAVTSDSVPLSWQAPTRVEASVVSGYVIRYRWGF